jgi:hypothetical protein
METQSDQTTSELNARGWINEVKKALREYDVEYSSRSASLEEDKSATAWAQAGPDFVDLLNKLYLKKDFDEVAKFGEWLMYFLPVDV